MDYYQGVVLEYLRANRTVFVNFECCIQLEPGDNPDKGSHWYCDAVAVDFAKSAVFLCEISYAKSLGALIRRLADWNDHWNEIRVALTRDCSIPTDFVVQPWIFFPKTYEAAASAGLERLRKSAERTPRMPFPRISFLEDVVPWKYRSWDRSDGGT
jgi:hypothetical protein